MKRKQFKTDLRLWFWISLVLFLVPWFLPIWGVNGDTLMPAAIWLILIEHPDHLFESLACIFMFTLSFGVPAVSIGWILHCITVMIRDTIRRRRDHVVNDLSFLSRPEGSNSVRRASRDKKLG